MSNAYEVTQSRDIMYVAGSGYQTTPDLAVGITVTGGTTPAFGSWAEIKRFDDDVLIVGFHVGPSSAIADASWIEFEFGFGESSSEITVWQLKYGAIDSITAAGSAWYRATFFPRFLYVPSGIRLSARTAASASSAALRVSLNYVYRKDVRVMA